MEGGNGMLTAVVIDEVHATRTMRRQAITPSIWALAVELIPSVEGAISLCEAGCRRLLAQYTADIRSGNCILDASYMLSGNRLFDRDIPRVEAAILNLSYRELGKDSKEMAGLRSGGIVPCPPQRRALPRAIRKTARSTVSSHQT